MNPATLHTRSSSIKPGNCAGRTIKPANEGAWAVAGSYVVPLADFFAKLGGVTGGVYRCALSIRNDQTSHLWLGNEEIARRTGIPLRAVKAACAKLKRIGLFAGGAVGDELDDGVHGWRLRLNRRGQTYLAYVRGVFGSFAAGEVGSDSSFIIPAETMTWYEAPSGHGGARAGAGRPRRRVSGACGSVVSQAPVNPHENNQVGPDHDPGSNSSRSVSPEETLRSDQSCKLPDSPSENPARAREVVYIEYTEPPTVEVSTPAAGKIPEPVATTPEVPPVRDTKPESHTEVSQGQPENASETPDATADRLGFFDPFKPNPLPSGTDPNAWENLPPGVRRELAGLPRAPDPKDFLVETPRPPKLARELTAFQRADYLARIYRRAVETRHPDTICREFSRGSVAKSKHYDALVACAEKLIEFDVSPVSWALWHCDQWALGGRNRVAVVLPPVRFVFDPARVVSQMVAIFRREGQLQGGRSTLTEEHRLLWRAWARADLHLDRSKTLEEARERVRRVLDEVGWANLERAARRARVEAQRAMDARVDNGEIVWGY